MDKHFGEEGENGLVHVNSVHSVYDTRMDLHWLGYLERVFHTFSAEGTRETVMVLRHSRRWLLWTFLSFF